MFLKACRAIMKGQPKKSYNSLFFFVYFLSEPTAHINSLQAACLSNSVNGPFWLI